MRDRARRFTPFGTVLVPIFPGQSSESLLSAARLIAGEGRVLLVGVIGVEPGGSLSAAAQPARHLRKTLRSLANGAQIRGKARVRVSHLPWQELKAVVQEEEPDLMLLEWPGSFEALHMDLHELMAQVPCDTALVRGPIPDTPGRVLIPIRGGPYAELALRLSLAIGQSRDAELTSLHIVPSPNSGSDAPFQPLARVLVELREVIRRQKETSDPAAAILKGAAGFDLIVMGISARTEDLETSIGPVAERVLRESRCGVIAVRTMRPMDSESRGEVLGHEAISILVDKWFAENTFHGGEFARLERLMDLKREQGLKISLAMPALNEEGTIRHVCRTMQRALMERVPLLDEIVLIDSDSTDRTRDIAEELGIPVFIHQRILPRYGPRRGKGEALWKSLYVTCGDLVVWIDTDITNPHPRLVYGILGPLLLSPRIQFVKGFYRRPLRVGDQIQAGGGGRVTELAARPLLNLFYPELSGVIQPLSGEYGGRRSALEQLPFSSGYGVETGLLIDVFERFGLTAIAQVDLLERIHRNQPLEPLSKMSFAIIQTVVRRLERRYGRVMLEDVNKTMKLIRREDSRYFLDVEEIAEKERPPMLKIPEYKKEHLR